MNTRERSGLHREGAFSEASAQEAGSRRGESISSKLDKLVESEKSIKSRLEDFDRKYRGPSRERATDLRAEVLRYRESATGSEEQEPLRMRAKHRKDPFSSASRSTDKPRETGKYPNYLEPGITAYSRAQRRREPAPQTRAECAEEAAQPLQAAEEESRPESREPRSRHFSAFNCPDGAQLLPRVVNLRISSLAKTLETIAGPQMYSALTQTRRADPDALLHGDRRPQAAVSARVCQPYRLAAGRGFRAGGPESAAARRRGEAEALPHHPDAARNPDHAAGL